MFPTEEERRFDKLLNQTTEFYKENYANPLIEIEKLTTTLPNDQDLGREVRKIISARNNNSILPGKGITLE